MQSWFLDFEKLAREPQLVTIDVYRLDQDREGPPFYRLRLGNGSVEVLSLSGSTLGTYDSVDGALEAVRVV